MVEGWDWLAKTNEEASPTTAGYLSRGNFQTAEDFRTLRKSAEGTTENRQGLRESRKASGTVAAPKQVVPMMSKPEIGILFDI
jgi:hypothetical protein